MEIDLNYVVSEVDRVGNCNGDCDKKGDGCCFSSSNSSSSSNTTPPVAVAFSSIYMELWHACAGPLTTLPKKGNVIVYFPQGHLEQAAPTSHSSHIELPNFDLRPQIFCTVMDVQLLANKENDEVYTQLSLLPVPEKWGINLERKHNEDKGVDEEDAVVTPTKSTPHMFCKTLTASDTSTHGGFSVPRRAAEDCFPPLNYTEQRPSQELIAKDLHGVEWKFRHIYRGQPRRHLLTTGWSIFVSQKNLVSGDAVLFLRGQGGELSLGIRRAARPKIVLPDLVTGNQRSYHNVLSSVANAISTKSVFPVFYSPRATHADFVVAHEKYLRSITNQIPIGTRFKMKFDMDDASERRFSGLVTGIGDLDPNRWPNSKWRCLAVRWDDDQRSGHQNRVSPWEIDLTVSPSNLSIQSSPRLKKLRASLQATPTENPIGGIISNSRKVIIVKPPLRIFSKKGEKSPNMSNILVAGRVGFVDFEESLRSSKVLQGQENVCLTSPNGHVKRNHSHKMPSIVNQSVASNGMGNNNITEFVRAMPSTTYTGFLESNRFPGVLQGQEIYSFRSLTGTTDVKPGTSGNTDISGNMLNIYQRPKANFYPLASEGTRNMYFPYSDIYKAGQPGMISYTNFPNETVPNNPSCIQYGVMKDEGTKPNLSHKLREVDIIPSSHNLEMNCSRKDDGIVTGSKLFGFPLTGGPSASTSQCSCKRSCTKVHKQGNLVGRAIDLSKLNGYDDLLIELERLFSMEGLLKDPAKGWHVLFTDDEDDMMVVGDDPWNEFCRMVSKIHIHTQEEVQKMMIGVISDDTQSCLEETPVVMDA